MKSQKPSRPTPSHLPADHATGRSKPLHMAPLGYRALEPRMVFDGAATDAAQAVAKITPAPDASQPAGHDATLDAAPVHARAFGEAPHAPREVPLKIGDGPSENGNNGVKLPQASAALDQREQAAGLDVAPSGPAVVFIDSSSDREATQISGVAPGAIVVRLDANSDGLHQVADALRSYSDLSRIVFVSQGDHAQIQLGNAIYNEANVAAQAAVLSEIGSGLAREGIISFQDGAGHTIGGALSMKIALLTGANVATADPASDAATLVDGHSAQATATPNEIFFVWNDIQNWQQIVSELGSSRVVILDGNRDGVEQIAAALASEHDLAAIHIVSHGSEGQLRLGTAMLNAITMQNRYLGELTTIGQAMSADGDILIYGCDFAGGDSGLEAAMILGGITGADIAASTDPTGAAARGGDWDLEEHTGAIGAHALAAKAYQGLLATPVAVADAFTTTKDAPITFNPRGNDSDADGDALVIVEIDSIPVWGGMTVSLANGSVLLNNDGTTTFTPNAGYVGSASFSYTVSDGHGGFATATATGTVTPDNHPPVIDLNSGTIHDPAYDTIVNGNLDGTPGSSAPANWTYSGQVGGGSIVAGGSGNVYTFAGPVTGEPPTLSQFVTGLNHGPSEDGATVIELDFGWARGTGDNTLNLWIGGEVYLNIRMLDFMAAADAEYGGGTYGYSPAIVPGAANVTTNTIRIGFPSWMADTGAVSFQLMGSGTNIATIDNIRVYVDADHDITPGVDWASTYTAAGAPVAIADTDATARDADTSTLQGAIIVLNDQRAGDVLSVGTLPAGIIATTDTSVAGRITIALSGAATSADYATAIRAIAFHSTNGDPTFGGTDTSRSISVTVNDGNSNSAAAHTTLTIQAGSNTAPVAVNDFDHVTTAIRPTSTIYYNTGQGTDPKQMIAIDTATGVHTVVGTLAQYYYDVARSPSGAWYSISAPTTTGAQSLYSFDPVTGAQTLIGAVPAGFSFNSLTFDTDGKLYMSGGLGGGIYQVNTATGASTNLGGNISTAGDIVIVGDSIYASLTGGQLVRLDKDYISAGYTVVANLGAFCPALAQLDATHLVAFPNTVGGAGLVIDLATGAIVSDARFNNLGQIPAGASEIFAIDRKASGNVLPNDSDTDGNAITVISFGQGTTVSAGTTTTGTYGTLVINPDGSYTYTLNPNDPDYVALNGAHGTEVFTYTISDGHGGTSTATLTIDLNDQVKANSESVTTPEDTAVSGNVLTNDASTTGRPITVTGFTVAGDSVVHEPGSTVLIAGKGTIVLSADGTYTFTPLPNYNSSALPPVIFYTVADNAGHTDTAELVITVTPVNDAPDAVADVYVAGTPVPTGPTSTQVIYYTDDSRHLYEIDTRTGLQTIYTLGRNFFDVARHPNGQWYGVDNTGFYRFDPVAGTTTLINAGVGNAYGYFSLGFAPNGTLYATTGSGFNTIDLTTGTKTSVGNPGLGSSTAGDLVVIGNFAYISHTTMGLVRINLSNIAGGPTVIAPTLPATSALSILDATHVLAYGVGAAVGGRPTDAVIVDLTTGALTLSPYNIPTSVGGLVTYGGGGEGYLLHPQPIGGVLLNDTDPENDALAVTQFRQGATTVAAGGSITSAYGMVRINADGSYTYTVNTSAPAYRALAAGQTANDLFPYTISDGHGGFDTATLTVVVTGVNDTPVTDNETNSTPEDSILVVNAANGVLVGDTDVDGDALTVTQFAVAGMPGTFTAGSTATITGVGQLAINADGSYSFSPASDYSGAVPIATYTISDGHGGAATGTLSLAVTPVNDAPIIDLNSGSTTTVTTSTSTSNLVSNGGFGTTLQAAPPSPWVEGGTAAAGSVVLNGSDGRWDWISLPNATLTQVITVPSGSISQTSTATSRTEVVTAEAVSSISFGLAWQNDDVSGANDNRLSISYGGIVYATFTTFGGGTANAAGLNGTWAYFAGASGPATTASVTNEQTGALTTITITLPSGVTASGDLVFSYLDGPSGVGADDIAIDNVAVTSTRTVTTTVTTITGPADGSYDWNASYTENGAPISIASTNMAVFDVDDTNMESATITLTNPQPGDRLLVNGSTGASGTLPVGVPWSRSGNTITLTGSFSKSVYAAAIQHIQFDSTSENPSTVDRIINTTVNDGTDISNTAVTRIAVSATNDLPVTDNETNTTPEDTILTVNAANGVLVGDTDIDGDTLAVTQFTVAGVAGSFAAGTTANIAGRGLLTIFADGSYTFSPATNYNGAVPVATYTVSDGHGGTATGTLTLKIGRAHV